jgi:hypothetical protein
MMHLTRLHQKKRESYRFSLLVTVHILTFVNPGQPPTNKQEENTEIGSGFSGNFG